MRRQLAVRTAFGVCTAVVASFPALPFVPDHIAEPARLAGKAVEAVERYGTGGVTVFLVEPDLRAHTDGTAELLRDAISGTPTPDRAERRRGRRSRGAVTSALRHTGAQHVAHGEEGGG